MTGTASEWFEEVVPTQDTVKDLDVLCEKYVEAREKADAMKAELSELNKNVDDFEKKLVTILDEHKKKSWEFGGRKFGVTVRMSVTTPKDPTAKEAFYSHLKDKGIFEDMVSINYQTLNGYFKQEMESALERGDTGYQMPGIGSPTYTSGITMRKGK